MTHGLRASLVAVTLATVVATSLPLAVCADDLKDGRTFLQAGKYDQAIQSFEKAASQGYAAGRAGVGQVWLRRRQLDKANEQFLLAQKMDPNLALAYWGQGEVLRQQEKCADAIALYSKATDLDRKFPEAQLALGECLVLTKQFDKGLAALTVGLGWGTKWRPRFLTALGRAEESRDSLRAAGIYFTRAREEAADDATVRKELGEFYFRRGTWALSILENQAAVALDSTDVDIHFSLGQALFYDQRYNDALDEFVWVVKRDPDYAPAQLSLGNLLYLSGAADAKRYAEARGPLDTYTKLKPNDPKGWSLLGRTDSYIGRKDEAVVELQKAEQLGDNSKEMYTLLGRSYADKKDWSKALEYFGRGDPSARDLLLIGQMYVFQGNQQRADSIYTAIIDKDSTTGDAKFAMTELGKGRFRQKDYPGALALLNRRIALDPNNGEAYYYIGLSYKEMKQYPEALEALRKAATIDSTKGERHFWLGILYAQQKDDEQARAALERSVALDSTSKTAGVAYRQLGYYRLLQKDWNGAIELLERAVQLSDQDVQALVWLGQGYQNSGNRGKAMDSYKRALALDPKQPDALKGVQILSGGAGAPKGGTK
jgi:tetratricopeptide (TPR) repeat protein